jgi:hypothetical protein
MADITLPSPTPQSESAKALRSSYLCYFLATLAMCVIGWFVIEGIEATAPNSSARYAKIAGGVLQMILGGYVFSLAGQYKEQSFILRALGWSIFGLNIVMMTLANYAINATAGKDAALSNATVAEIRAQADASRSAAKSLQESAAKQAKSKNTWVNVEGGKNATAAAQQTAAAAGAAEKLEKMRSSLTSTPMIEIIGEGGMMALSFVQALILELCNIVLMHMAGVQRRKASGGVPVEYQILELLHEMRGTRATPAAPALSLAKTKTKAKAIEAPQATQEDPAEEDPASAPARAPADDKKPAFGFIPTMSKLKRFDTSPVNDDTPHIDHFPSNKGINVDTPTPVNDDTPNTLTKARKARVARDGLPMDSGTGPLDGFRYRRALVGVQAHTIRPSLSGLYQGVGATADVARRYLAAMAAAGEIVRNKEDTAWIPTPKKAKAKKGGAA